MTPSQTPETPNPPAATEDEPRVDLSRRRLAGVGASAIFTLASRPVLAVQCNSPSAAASGNLSHHGMAPNCTGQTRAQWIASLTVSDPRNVTFHPPPPPSRSGVFTDGGPGSRADWGNRTLRQVMQAADNGNATSRPNPISAEFAATLLNIRDGRIPDSILTEVALIHMWNEWMDSGAFTPKLGASWNAAQIVNYLRSLQGI